MNITPRHTTAALGKEGSCRSGKHSEKTRWAVPLTRQHNSEDGQMEIFARVLAPAAISTEGKASSSVKS